MSYLIIYFNKKKDVVDPFKHPRILSLCTGVRGLERGIERAIGRTRTVAIVEIESFIIENLLAGMEAGLVVPAPLWSNLKTFDGRKFRGLVDAIVGGYPCQPFSNSGKREGTKDPRHLWPYIERLFETVKPVWGFFENVSGHLSLGFDEVYRSLSSMGYRVEAGIYSAEEVGAPHVRERLFILAMDDAYSLSPGVESLRLYWPTGTGNGGFAQPGTKGSDVNYPTGSRSEMDDAACKGFQTDRMGKKYIDEEPFHANMASHDKWPARPGDPQHPWEESRTIESRMGCAVNGYNFREDFLRALGNGVVEQAAELAFRSLIRKHIDSYLKHSSGR